MFRQTQDSGRVQVLWLWLVGQVLSPVVVSTTLDVASVVVNVASVVVNVAEWCRVSSNRLHVSSNVARLACSRRVTRTRPVVLHARA